MRRSLAGLVAAVLLVSGACTGDEGDRPATRTTAGGTTETTGGVTAPNQTFNVSVDNRSDRFNAAYLAYFPSSVSARPGDTISFTSIYTGEPHSVTMGTLVEKGLDAARRAAPDGPPPPELAALPSMLPEGPGDAVQSAGQPCFLETGNPPVGDRENKPCPKVAQPPFNGRQAYYSSGFLPDGAKFNVKLADDIAPGTYRYYCNLHGPDQQGSIEVRPRGSSVPPPGDVDKAGRDQLQAIVAKLGPAFDQAKAGQIPFPGVTNLAGYGVLDVQTALINEFVPATITARVGQKVTWALVGPHTISFNAPPDAQPILTTAPDGSVHLNTKAVAPAGGWPGAPEEQDTGPPPTGPPRPPRVIDAGRFDGTGFRSSGVIFSGPPNLKAYGVTFTKAGTYAYVCLIHPKMVGNVKVT